MQSRSEKNLCQDAGAFLASLAHPTRLAILCHLTENGGACVSELVGHLGLAQPMVSQFLARMSEEKLVGSERDGRQVRYFIADRRVFQMFVHLRDIFCVPKRSKKVEERSWKSK